MVPEAAPQPEWGAIKLWQVMDPAIDWRSILTPDQIRQIAVIQIDVQMKALQLQLDTVKQIREIVTQKR